MSDEMSHTSSLSETEMITESNIEKLPEIIDDSQETKKRDRDSDGEGEWKVVQAKKCKAEEEKIEIYASSSEKMPKQFALAKLLQKIGIGSIEKVKYINAYKIRLEMSSVCAERFENCQELSDLGWRIQRAMEVSLCYGVIRDVDIDLTEEEIMKSITCPEPAVLVSVSRLMRRERNSEGNSWKPSESVRLCFRGSFRPPYVTVDDIRIRVELYIFPVSQCTRCWRLGHVTTKCSSSVKVCPKCSGSYENCDTTAFKCVNCGGHHISLLRICPAYIKEKRLRELMAEFNCTYRRALTIYVPFRSTAEEREPRDEQQQAWQAAATSEPVEAEPSMPRSGRSYLNATKQKPAQKDERSTKGSCTAKNPKKQKEEVFQFNTPNFASTSSCWVDESHEEEKKRDVTFIELLNRLREIIFLRGETMKVKVNSVIKCCLEWLILVVVDNVSDWPILKSILDYFSS